MMIELFSGTPGSGKSLHAVSEVRFHANVKKLPVLINFSLSPDAPLVDASLVRSYANADLSPALLMRFADDFWADPEHPFREDGILLVLDEAQLLFNSRLWSDKTRMAWLEFFSQHRKYGYRVIFVAQSAKMIDNQFRMLVEYEVNHRCVSTSGTLGWLLALPFRGLLFMTVRYLFQYNERLSSHFFVGMRRDCAMYDTRARFERS